MKNWTKNEIQFMALSKEAEKLLSPCAHCGRNNVRIVYWISDTGGPTGNHPHAVFAMCYGSKDDKIEGVCDMQSKTWYAEDNEDDFTEALRLVVGSWNRRPTC